MPTHQFVCTAAQRAPLPPSTAAIPALHASQELSPTPRRLTHALPARRAGSRLRMALPARMLAPPSAPLGKARGGGRRPGVWVGWAATAGCCLQALVLCLAAFCSCPLAAPVPSHRLPCSAAQLALGNQQGPWTTSAAGRGACLQGAQPAWIQDAMLLVREPCSKLSASSCHAGNQLTKQHTMRFLPLQLPLWL